MPKADLSLIPDRLKQHLNLPQQEGVALAIAALDKDGGFLNADGAGFGKSRQQLAVASTYAERGKKVLIVSKAEVLKPNWEKGRVTGSFDSDGRLMGARPKLTKGFERLRRGRISISTYENLEALQHQVDKDTVLILDEAHSLKNAGSVRARHGMNAVRKAGAVMYATATPEDKPAQIGYLERAGLLKGHPASKVIRWLGFEEVDATGLDGKPEKQWVVNDEPDNIYHRLTGLFDEMTERGQMVRREISLDGVKVDFVDIKPPKEAVRQQKKIRRAIEREPGATEGGLTEARILMAQRRHLETHKVPAAVDLTKQALSKNRQVVLFAARVNDSEVRAKRVNKQGELFKAKITESGGTISLLRKQLESEGVKPSDIVEIHGNQTKRRSIEAMNAFQAGNAKVVITTVESGGTGINLDDRDGDKPRTLIMMTPPFSAVDNVQAAGRVWRASSNSLPEIKYLMSDSPIDQWNKELIVNKMSALNASVQGEVAKLIDADIVTRPGIAPRLPDELPNIRVKKR